MDRLRSVALALALVGCTPSGVASATSAPPPTAIFPSLAIETGTPPPLPSPTAVPLFTPRVGGCTEGGIDTRAMLERYFTLTTSGDPAAVLDCFARAYRERFAGDEMRASAITFASQGRVTELRIEYIDSVNGCDRYAAAFQFEQPDPLFPNGFGIIYTIGPEEGMPRIYDGGTGMLAPQLVTTTCH